jgi:hypothetical protein
MRRSVGYGAYDGFGEDIPSQKPAYKGSTPIRLGRGSLEIKGKDSKGLPINKRYTAEAGVTPFGIILTLLGGAGFVYFIFQVTGRIFK